MATLSKKKKATFPGMTTSREAAGGASRSDGVGKEEKSSSKRNHTRGASIISLSGFYGQNNNPSNRNLPSNYHDTSMDELASRLLDDSNLSQFQVHPSRRLSQQSITNVLHNLPSAPKVYKDLPQLPQLQFNNDDAWALQFRPVTTADGEANTLAFPSDEPNRHSSNLVRESSHKRKPSGPGLPRKSSKRITARERHRKQITHKAAEAERSRYQREKNGGNPIGISSPLRSIPRRPREQHPAIRSSPPMYADQPEVPESTQPGENEANLSVGVDRDHPEPAKEILDADRKIRAMLEATAELKGKVDNGILQRGPPTLSKKKFRGKQILARVKHAFTNHRNEHSKKKPHDPARDGLLLHESLNHEQDEDEPARSIISSVESRVNEGLNLNNPKVRSITGHGNIARKPLPDDGRSLRSRKSYDDPFSQERSLSKNGISDNLDQYPPLVPQIASRSTRSPPTMPPLPAITVHPPSIPSRFSTSSRPSGIVFSSPQASAFDDLLSSSPEDKSTPGHYRWKLEPSIQEDGTRGRLMAVSASTPSLLDRDESYSPSTMNPFHPRSSPSPPMSSTMNLDVVDADVTDGLVPNDGSKRKKHPSPSKSELEKLGKGLCSLATIMSASPTVAFPPPTKSAPSTTITPLRVRDTNSAVGASSHPPRVESRGFRRDIYTENNRSQQSLRKPSMVPRSARGEIPIRRPRHELRSNSNCPMDTSLDELQWNNRRYTEAGMRRC